MRNRELEQIARVLATPGELMTDGECLGAVWDLLVGWGIDPEDFRTATDPVPTWHPAYGVRTWERVRDAVAVDTDPTPPHGIARPDLGGQLLDLDDETPSPFGSAID